MTNIKNVYDRNHLYNIHISQYMKSTFKKSVDNQIRHFGDSSPTYSPTPSILVESFYERNRFIWRLGRPAMMDSVLRRREVCPLVCYGGCRLAKSSSLWPGRGERNKINQGGGSWFLHCCFSESKYYTNYNVARNDVTDVLHDVTAM